MGMVDTAKSIVRGVVDRVAPGFRAERSRLADEVARAEEAIRAHAAACDQRASDLRNLMATEWGRRIVWALLKRCQYQGSAWHQDPRISERIDGQRTIAIELAGEIVQVSTEDWLLMHREHLNAGNA